MGGGSGYEMGGGAAEQRSLAVKGGARHARLRPGGRLRPLTACAAPCWRRFRAIPPE